MKPIIEEARRKSPVESKRGVWGSTVSWFMPAKKKLDAYKGMLNPAEISEGMNAASKNANRLVDDAFVLLGARRFASALALGILSIEEAGKIPILRPSP